MKLHLQEVEVFHKRGCVGGGRLKTTGLWLYIGAHFLSPYSISKLQFVSMKADLQVYCLQNILVI